MIMHSSEQIIVLLLLLVGMAASIRWKKLTIPAALTGGIVGWLVYAGGGYTGIWMLAAFFILGTVATSWHANVGRSSSEAPGSNDQTGSNNQKGSAAQSTRTVGQVLANGGVAALAGLCILYWPGRQTVLEIAMAASLSSATADTLSSELGMIYGRRFYHILAWKPDQRGKDGVVSVEGTLIGVAGSAVISTLYAAGHKWSPAVGIIILAGTVGNLVDSILGAALERKGYIGNNMVNFLNTLTAGLLAGALAYIAGNM